MKYVFLIIYTIIAPINLFTQGFFLESKHFASVYAVNENNVIPYGFGTKDINITNLPHSVHCADTLFKEKTESIIYAAKNNPNILYELDIQRNNITEFIIPSATTIPLFVHAIATNQHLIFVALSSDPENFDTKESKISCFLIQPAKDEEPALLKPCFREIPLEEIKKITKKEDTKAQIKKIYVDSKASLLFCCFDFMKEHGEHDSEITYDYVVSFLEKKEGTDTVEWILEASNFTITKKNIQLFDSTIFHTSTALSYIIFLTKAESLYKVQAMPLQPDGKKATENAHCEDVFFKDGLKRFIGRHFVKESTKEELKNTKITIENENLLVGNNSFPDNIVIKKIKILGDTICIIIDNEVFGSTALFDHEGKIKGWTNWKKIIEHKTHIDDIHIDRFTGQYLILSNNSIKKSVWQKYTYNNSDKPFRAVTQKIINNEIEKTVFFAIDATTLYDLNLNNDSNDVEKINIGEIQEIGELISLYNYHNTTTEKNYLLISGTRGIVQAEIDEKNIIKNVKKISDIGQVKKIIIDQDIMYAMSPYTLHRILLTQEKSIEENIEHAELLIDTKKQIHFGFFTDIIISDACILLATGSGIWLLKEGSIRKETPQFVHAHFPETIGIPVMFFVRSATEKETDFAQLCGSNIFVLFCDVMNDQSKIYRLSVQPTINGEIQFDTVSFFNDVILRNTPTSFLNFSIAQSSFFTDGIRYLLPSSGKQVSLFPQPKLGIVWSGNKLQTLFDENNNKQILYIGTHSLSGNLLISTAQELYVHA